LIKEQPVFEFQALARGVAGCGLTGYSRVGSCTGARNRYGRDATTVVHGATAKLLLRITTDSWSLVFWETLRLLVHFYCDLKPAPNRCDMAPPGRCTVLYCNYCSV